MKTPLKFLRLLILLVPSTTEAAVQIEISNDVCLISACPATHPPAPTTVLSGAPFNLYFAAFNAVHGYDATYRGTVTFTSTDPLAALPPTYTFIAADAGIKTFPGVTLRTPGPQTITAVDATAGLSATLTLTVISPASVSIPILSDGIKVLLAIALALSGAWFARRR